jgi:1-acyl-sn-glycerol-3-phosphate acyltransferase
MRVVDSAGRELPDRREGRLQFRGPSSTSGYFRNAEATADLFDGDWLDTGDFAYLVDGDVYLSGRAKDIIIKAGRNIYPEEIERAVGEIDGVRMGCVAVFGSADKTSGTERLVIMAETRETGDQARADLRDRIEDAAGGILGEPPDDVALVAPQAVLKTSSGKIRRAANRAAYESGALSPARRAVWMQIARLGLSSLGPELRRLVRTFGEYLYSAWFWLIVGVAAGLVWPLVTVVPSRRFGLAALKAASRWILYFAAAPAKISGLENLPPGAKVLVVNHTGYVDLLMLFAALPGDLTFAAKGELKASWLTRYFIRHLGALFVERFETQRSVEDSAQLLDALKAGRTLVVFPEGTFVRMPGLLPFRMGAFTVAAEARAPIVPVVLKGSRAMLREGSWFARRSALSVTVCAPISSEGNDWSAAISLRDRVRRTMLEVGGEPDLAYETGQFTRRRE